VNRLEFMQQEVSMLRAMLVRWEANMAAEKAALVEKYCPVQVGAIIDVSLGIEKNEHGVTTSDPVMKEWLDGTTTRVVPVKLRHTPTRVLEKPLRVADIRMFPGGFVLAVQIKNGEEWGEPGNYVYVEKEEEDDG
jgi:hypothetical protein